MVSSKCPLCGNDLELPDCLIDGQHVRCPYCDGKFSYQSPKQKPLRVKLPDSAVLKRPRLISVAMGWLLTFGVVCGLLTLSAIYDGKPWTICVTMLTAAFLMMYCRYWILKRNLRVVKYSLFGLIGVMLFLCEFDWEGVLLLSLIFAGVPFALVSLKNGRKWFLADKRPLDKMCAIILSVSLCLSGLMYLIPVVSEKDVFHCNPLDEFQFGDAPRHRLDIKRQHTYFICGGFYGMNELTVLYNPNNELCWMRFKSSFGKKVSANRMNEILDGLKAECDKRFEGIDWKIMEATNGWKTAYGEIKGLTYKRLVVSIIPPSIDRDTVGSFMLLCPTYSRKLED